MTIDNTSFVMRDRKLIWLMTLSLPVFIPIFMLSDFFKNPVLGITREVYVIILCAIYVLFHIYRILLDYNFINISDEGNKLSIKYYSLKLLSKQYKAMEIPLNSLVKYSIDSSLMGQYKTLTLYQKIQGKLAKYPPLSISALSSGDIAKLKARLDTITRKN